MKKQQIIKELEEIIETLKLDRRSNIKGINIMLSEPNWDKKHVCNDSNLFMEWYI